MVYLDYAATSPLLPTVIDAMRKAEKKFFANASALHTPGHLAMNEIEDCRASLAKIIGAKPQEIIFTSGATESNNTVINTFRGYQIKTSPLEHHSILESASKYRGEKKPKLYSFMLANNETGEFLNIPNITEENKKQSVDQSSEIFTAKTEFGKPLVTDIRSAYLHSDLTQVLGKIPINVNKLHLDYATFSAHKIGGPVGVGALYIREGVPFKPLLIGGNQENKRRGGTYNTIGIIGFKAALDHISSNNTLQEYDTKVRNLRDSLAKLILQKIPESSLNTNLAKDKSLPNILSMSFKAAEGESIQLYLDAEEIIVSTGSACASGDIKPSHVLMAKTGDAEMAHSSIRFSFSPENTMQDVDKVMDVLPGIIEKLRAISTII